MGKFTIFKVFNRGLVIASLNINSLWAHIDELRIFISNTKIDILAINETKLDPSVKNNEIHLPGFEIVRKDLTNNGRNGGGVCIYIKNNINYTLREDLSFVDLECVSLKITNPN